MESVVDEQEASLVSWLFEMKNNVAEQEIESDFNDQEWGIDDDVHEEIESYAAEQSIPIAKQFLEATNWDLQKAIRLLFSAEVRYPNTSYELMNLGEANFRAEMVRSDVSATDNSLDDNLVSMYPPPLKLMYDGPFHKEKKGAEDEDKWLIVNVQSK
ncbi:putative plant UBX domain-containing protein 14 [Papaver somniferum]|uniref:putative plant UBX domain-containing protein 14 n=1 Tax=Papaver somniferum TaxID=3469 RepID=UPI000E6FFA8A|nr:putative plant UBX domain-containing protein 14 [Papaver somniferum]